VRNLSSAWSSFRVHAAAPTFLVDDIASTLAWYVDKLDFVIAGKFPAEAPHVFASLMRGGAEIMLLRVEGYRKPALTAPRAGGSWDAYIRVDGVVALYESITDKSVVQTPPSLQRYGDWEFEVRDPNGYVLIFGGSK
jgi:uncharacterized glyoxalase superfamily protein PhnB